MEVHGRSLAFSGGIRMTLGQLAIAVVDLLNGPESLTRWGPGQDWLVGAGKWAWFVTNGAVFA